MSTIALSGSVAGLGLSIARVFGKQGFQVALVARSREKLDKLVATLDQDGITAAGFTADILDRPSLESAFAQIVERFGDIDVLEFSPAPHTPIPGFTMADPLEVSPENLQPQLDYYLYGGIATAQQVLPAMIAANSGTLLFSTGGGSVSPVSQMASVNAASAALRNWVINLHNTVADSGVYVAHVAISTWIGQQGPKSDPDQIAQTYWNLYTSRDRAEYNYMVTPSDTASEQ